MDPINNDAYMHEALACRYINHYQHLEADGEIINLDYDPIKLYTALKRANEDQFDAVFHGEIIQALSFYITLGRRAWKIVRNPNNSPNLRISQIFRKYNITDQLQGNARRISKSITIPRLMRLFPHLLAKIVTVNMNVESSISEDLLEATGLSSISLACFFKSSFALLPKYEEDVQDKKGHLNIVKAMLLAIHEKTEIIQEENDTRAGKSLFERMQATFMNCKVIYDSNHLLGNIRWASYKAFLVNNPNTGEKFVYEKAAEVFDAKFPEMIVAVENAFALREGTGIERGTNVEEIVESIESMKDNRKRRQLMDLEDSETEDLFEKELEL